MKGQKKLRKIVTLCLALALAVSAFSGCGEKTVKNDEQVTLRWIVAAERQDDTEAVWSKFNEMLPKYLPNTQIEFTAIPLTDYAEQWRLIAAANEEYDMAWEGWVLDAKDEASKGAYIEISDLLTEYAPKLKASIPDWVWEGQKVDGKLYYIPNYQKMVSTGAGFYMLKDKADKYLDKEGFQNAINDWQEYRATATGLNQSYNDEMWDYLEEYLQNLKDADRLGLGFDKGNLSWIPFNGVANGYGKVAYVIKDENGKYIAKDMYAPENAELIKKLFARMRSWNEKGFFRKDVLTATSNTTDTKTEEGYAVWSHLADDYTAQLESTPEVPIHITRLSFKSIPFNKPSDTNSVIPANAKNPERAMMMYEVLNDKETPELLNLLTYGIEGKHYEKTGENKIKRTDTKSYSVQAFLLGNTFNVFEHEASVDGYNDYVLNVLHNEENHEKPADPKLSNFKFDEGPVKGYVAQMTAIQKEYDGLRAGIYADWEERYDKMVNKMNQSGKDKIIEEVQRQLDEQLNK